MKQYDYLIVGAGLFGAVFAHEVTKRGKKCLVVDKRKHIGGNVYCDNINTINVHAYGAHFFHTNDDDIWNYVNSFVSFNRYTNSPLAVYQNKVYNLPFNMNTFNQLWNVKTPEEAKNKIFEQTAAYKNCAPKNLEEQALTLVGKDIYEYFIREYTEKQWGKDPKELPAFIIKRIPLRFTYDNNYFNDKYQGIPVGGYNVLINSLLRNISIRTAVDYFESRYELEGLADKIVFTGKIDEYYNYRYGELEYRSLKFEHIQLDTPNYQGNAVVNYTEKHIPYTRIIEHKHFEFGSQDTTVITKEYPETYSKEKDAYYPINDDINNKRYNQYRLLANNDESVLLGGRLAEFKYYDMHQVIASALKKVNTIYSD